MHLINTYSGIFLLCFMPIGFPFHKLKKKQAFFEHRPVSGNTKVISNTTYSHEKLQCGEWLKTFSDEISYKEDISVVENERCVWIIAVSLAIGYNFEITYLNEYTNLPNSGQELVLTGIRSQDSEQPVLTNHKPTETGNFTVSKAQVVIVTFHIGNLDGTRRNGFALKYNVIYGNSHVSALSTHHIFPSLTFDFKYPVDRINYEANELATFVFPPTRNTNNCQKNFLWYKSCGLDPDYDCKDSLFVYKFNVSIEGVGFYENVSRLCHSNATWMAESDDILLLIFQSNGNRQFSGFSMSYIGC